MMSYLSVFLLDFGWCGLLGAERTVCRLVIGHTSDAKVRQAIHEWISLESGRRLGSAGRSNGSINPRNSDPALTDSDLVDIPERDWFPELRILLQRFAQGVKTEFDDIKLQWPGQTDFQQRVIRATRRIRYGATVTYQQLASDAGAPKAARAVGNVMAANRFPIIVPCHRVVAAAGRLGGFSAPPGVSLKEQMLLLEDANPRTFHNFK